ncbi:hypothetical protein H5410_003303 [Solanum commersonii]|uniref:NADH:quinone oxidoreductase/Mrp antiporter transmembrane domain-containing protein n=1 Tax=Solanum commersonii TaxID=4109 RepID=A0A9J6B4Q6_SOLCO|nr:hypothetical protein H5410_003303 [Solanum commersonii]
MVKLDHFVSGPFTFFHHVGVRINSCLSTSSHVGRNEMSVLSYKIYFVHGEGFYFLLMGVLGAALYGSNEPTLNFETSVNQSYLVTWLPDTHGEAHYSTCLLLAGILLKMGAYGLIRINMALLPHTHSIFSPWLMIIGTIQIIHAASTSLGQRN